MSREAYQVPMSQTAAFGTGATSASTGGGPPTTLQQRYIGGTEFMRNENAVMRYLCGDCGSATELKKQEPIRCRDCGCRVLYKERTKRMIQFEAR